MSYKTVAPHAYAAAPHPLPRNPPGQHSTYHPTPTLPGDLEGNKEALLGSLTSEQAKAVVEASSKLGRVWLTTIPFQPSLRLTDFEVAAALQLRTLAGEREAHCTHCGETNFFGHLEVCLQRRFRRVADTKEPSTSWDRPLPRALATRLANAEYDLTVVSLANTDAPVTKLLNQDTDPSRLVNKYLDSVADHKVRHRPTSSLPFHPIVLSLGGMMNGSTTKVFAAWKRVITRGTYDLMLKRLSLGFLQSRVRSFEL
ncbi:hypothetical protein JCM24511_02595 [Saitozyma sp. JCM 24511]|nr:hypothetical protein JCM24511_02595 [Saitozyma sp. JCM 24511]